MLASSIAGGGGGGRVDLCIDLCFDFRQGLAYACLFFDGVYVCGILDESPQTGIVGCLVHEILAELHKE